MKVSGSSGAILYESEVNTRIRKNPKKIRLTGYADMEEQKAILLDKETYTLDSLQNYTELYFEGCEK